MKAFLYKAKGALALTLAMSMFCPQVFAAAPVALSAEEQGVKAAPVKVLTEEEIEAMKLPQLTFEEAFKKVKKHSPKLRDVQDNADYLQETKEDLWDAGYFDMPTYDYMKWVNDGWYAITSAAFQVQIGMEQNNISREMTELTLEATTKTFFTSILSLEDGLELTKKSAEMQQTVYEQGKRRYELGMLSKYQLDKLKANADQAKNGVVQLESALEQLYMKMNDMMGEKPEARFEYVYDVAYEPYEMARSLDMYIGDVLRNDIYVQLQELSVETAKFSKNYLPYSDNGSGTAQKELTLSQANRNLKTTKANMEVGLRNAALAIKDLETAYASAQTDLEKAQADLRVQQLNYQIGNVTKLAVTQAEMAVITAENALKQNAYDHDAQIFQFENPSVMMLMSGQQ